jgi:hypothetical protein
MRKENITNTINSAFNGVVRRMLFNHFYVETEWAEAIVATDHRTHRIFHPAVEKIAFAFG